MGSGGAQYQLMHLANFLSKTKTVFILSYTEETFFQEKLLPAVNQIIYTNKLAFFYGVLTHKKSSKAVISFLDFPNLINLLSVFVKTKTIYSERNGRPSLRRANWRSWPIWLGGMVVYNNFNLYEQSHAKIPIFIPNMRTSGRCGKIINNTKVSGILRVAVFASISRVKNPKTLLLMLEEIGLVQGNRIIVNWFGEIKESDYAKEISDLIRESNNFNYQGPFRDLFALKDSYDVGLLFSDYEGFSNSILDHLTLGKPVIIAPGLNIGPELEELVYEMSERSIASLENSFRWALVTLDKGIDPRLFEKKLDSYSQSKIGKLWLELIE